MHLHLSDCVGEMRNGLATLLYFACKNCSEVTTVSTEKQLTTVQNSVLFAQNIILCNALTKCNFYLLNEYISGFCDTLPMLKEQISAKTTSFPLEIFVRNIHMCTYDAYDAVEYCTYLKKIIEHSSICINAYHLNNSFITYYIMSITKQMENTKSNLQLLMPLIPDSILKKNLFLGTFYQQFTISIPKKGV